MSETEKAQLAEIRAARGRVKASLTRLENTFDEINTRNEISIRLSRLDDLFKEFERLDSNLSLEEFELQEFEERYFYLNAKFNDKLDELNVQNQGRTQNSVASSITSNSNVGNFRLPKLSIPQFNGHFKDWINFKDLFVSTVHSQVSISNVEKFQYLKDLLTNEPASLIKHMPISNDSYEEAWQKLLDRYNNKKQIVQSLIKTFLDQKPISEANCFNLRKLLDTSDECLRGLNALGEQASSKDCWLIYLLLQKIDPESRRLWAIKSSEEEFPNMKAFLDFLNGNETSQGEGASAETRNEAIEFKGQAGELQIYSGASVNCELNLSFLPTANVKIFYNNNSNESIICRALLDSGSECCFTSERVVNILGLKRKSSKISLRRIAGVTAGQTKGCVDLVIGSQSSNERLEVNAFILNKVTSQIPSEFLDVKDLDYLKSIPLSDEELMSPKECDIILGSDCFFDILRSGKIVGSKNEPIAQRTMFGWVVAGKLNVKNKEPHELYSHFLSTENELNTDSLLQRFWETEELSVKKQFLSDEQFCENHFKSNYKYNDKGGFVVKLPIYKDTSRLGNTKGIAISRLLAMERRFQVDKDFERQYKNFMIEYESLEHMIPPWKTM
ncbi:uncharacterized protein TNCV_1903801 [Trichonephila clavipes]|nr:uncharacterized protein TNCV_1903801 [Trichonephila clavipes]